MVYCNKFTDRWRPAQRDRIRIIDGFVGIINKFVRTMDLLLENKKIAKKKSLIGQGLIGQGLIV